MNATLEDQLLEQYGGQGRGQKAHMPQTLLFDHVSPATRLLEKRRQMFEVQEALNSQKEEFGRREDAFRRREDGLRRKDLELQESLIKYNKFLQEIEQKRIRASKRIAEEKKQREILEAKIKVLETTYKGTLEEETKKKAELEKNQKYQNYLEGVVDQNSKFFKNIPDVLKRYDDLSKSYEELAKKQNSDELKADQMNRDCSEALKQKENQAFNVNRSITEMKMQVTHYKSMRKDLQVEVDEATKEAADKLLGMGQILSSVSNILFRCEESFRTRHNKPKRDKYEEKLEDKPLPVQCAMTMTKLEEIQTFIKDLQDIVKEYKESGEGYRFKPGSSLSNGMPSVTGMEGSLALSQERGSLTK
jgi:vacuolar-type H+-ATPase subunit I/STV1